MMAVSSSFFLHVQVVTNYLASANLVSISEALVTTKAAGIDLTTAFEAIRISSGNSFVHETESQVGLRPDTLTMLVSACSKVCCCAFFSYETFY